MHIRRRAVSRSRSIGWRIERTISAADYESMIVLEDGVAYFVACRNPHRGGLASARWPMTTVRWRSARDALYGLVARTRLFT